MGLPLADLARFEDTHNERLGFHARNIKAVAPEVRYILLNPILTVAYAEWSTYLLSSECLRCDTGSFDGVSLLKMLQHANVHQRCPNVIGSGRV